MSKVRASGEPSIQALKRVFIAIELLKQEG